MRKLPRYVLDELLKVFLVSLTALTLIVIIVGVVKEATSQSLPPMQVICLIPYILPDALRIAVPVTLLLAATSVYGRMAGSNEIVAIKSLGISPMLIVWPTVVVAVLMSLVTVWLNDLAVSWGRNGAQRVVIEAVEEIIYGILRTQRRYSSDYFTINVKRVEGRTLIRPTLWVKARGNAPAITITAAEAELRSDRAEGVLKIILRDGTIDVEGRADHVQMRFPNDVFERDIPLRDASRAERVSKNPSWLSLKQIAEQTEPHRAAIEQYKQELAARAAYQMLGGDFDGLTSREWETRTAELGGLWAHYYRLRTEPHRRWSAGFSCLSFVWIGVPMAIRRRNRDFFTSFFLCFLPILIVYYPMLMYGVDGAKNGTIPPYAVWTGNLLLLGWGTYMLRKVIRY